MDGNRTRRTRIARSSRFEGGGVHQVPGHLRRSGYRSGLRMILEQWNHSRTNGLDLSILPGSGQVQRVFAMTALAELLPFADGPSSL